MSKPNEYLMYSDVISLLEKSKPSLHLLRLFHACFAYTDRNPLLTVGIVAMPDRPACTALCSNLAAITGSPSAKSTAWIKTVVKEFNATDLFSQLSLDQSGKLLHFKFSPKVANASIRRSKRTPFAMLDSDEVATISSASELLFYTRAIMVGASDHPSFYIPGIGPEATTWTDDSKKSWLRVAARVGERLQQHYLVLPERDPLCRAIVRVRVKVVTQQSSWSPECLFPRRSCAGVSVVHDGKHKSLTNKELFERRKWTRITAP